MLQSSLSRVCCPLLCLAGCGKYRSAGTESNPGAGLVPSQADQSRYYGIHSRKGWSSLPVVLHVDGKFTDLQWEQILAAGATWNRVAERQLIQFERSPDNLERGYTIDKYLSQPIKAVVLLSDWCRSRKHGTALGTALWDSEPGDEQVLRQGNVFLNGWHFLTDTSADTLPEAPATAIGGPVDIQSLVLHELGHLLGLAHVPQADSVMQPSLTPGLGAVQRIPSPEDVARIRFIYQQGAPEPPQHANAQPPKPQEPDSPVAKVNLPGCARDSSPDSPPPTESPGTGTGEY